MDIQTLCLECTKDPYSRHGIINPVWSHLNESQEVLITPMSRFFVAFQIPVAISPGWGVDRFLAGETV